MAYLMQRGNSVPELPAEMIEEVVSRVDAQELGSVMLASKGFMSILSSKSFTKHHFQNTITLNRDVFLFQEEFCFTPLFYNAAAVDNAVNGRLATDDDKDCEILGASGSLVLSCNVADVFYLTNLITKVERRLPTSKIVYPISATWAQVIFGMGYVPEEDDYKIVRVSLFNSQDFKSEVMIFSRNTWSWSHGPDFPSVFPMCQPGVYVKGRLHWRSSIFFDKFLITSFDLKEGSFYSISMPKVPLIFGVQQMGRLDDDTLALSCSFQNQFDGYTIWILKDYEDDNSWYKLKVDLGVDVINDFMLALQPLCFIRPGQKRILIRLDPLGTFGIYDAEDQVFTEIESDEVDNNYMTPYSFIPSLDSPLSKKESVFIFG